MKVFEDLTFDEILRTSWSGAKSTAKRIDEEGKGEEFEQLIEDCYPEGIDRTALNDILWFDSEWVFEQLGIENDNEEDEEEDEEE